MPGCRASWRSPARRSRRTRARRSPSSTKRATTALVDGGNNVGYVAVYRGAEIAIAKARQSGVASVGVYNSYFSGRNAYYLEQIVKAGLVGMHSASGSPHIVPPGATRPALGTNPIAFGFPSADGPVIFDIGTASLMWGEVLLAAETGEELPEGVAYDADGNPTRDGKAAAKGGVSAWGGHKGYGLALAIQALGLLAGAAIAARSGAGLRVSVLCRRSRRDAARATRSRRRWPISSARSRRRRGTTTSRKSASRRSAPFASASAAAPKASWSIPRSSRR